MMTISLAIAVLAAAAALLAVWLIFGALVVPVATEPSQNIVAVLSVTGTSCSLEQTVAGLVWLARSGALEMDIIISDEGMDEETRLVAEKIDRRFREVSFVNYPQL